MFYTGRALCPSVKEVDSKSNARVLVKKEEDRIAQSVERWSNKPLVMGSIPIVISLYPLVWVSIIFSFSPPSSQLFTPQSTIIGGPRSGCSCVWVFARVGSFAWPFSGCG